MGLRERRLRRLNQVIEEQGFGEMILDKAAIFELLEILRDALDEIDTNPEKALVIGVLIDQKVQSSIGLGVLAARIISVVGIHVGELTPVIKGYTTQQLVNRIDDFIDNFDVQ
jgi:hypothetical protein